MSALTQALVFPAAKQAPLDVAVDWPLRGIAMRHAQTHDIAFLRALYGSLRADELAPLRWLEATRCAFLDSQFALQHHHYVSHFAPTDFLLVEQAGVPVGRFYLHRDPADFLLLDIALLPDWRGKGIGSSLISHAQRQAREAGASLSLHVEQRNHAARRLYQRLGFLADGMEGQHWRMRWSCLADQLNTA